MSEFWLGVLSGFLFGVGLTKLIDIALIYYSAKDIIIKFGVPIMFILGLIAAIIIYVNKQKAEEQK